MTNAQIGMKVEAYKGSCIGLLIQSTTWQGEIIKVNKKSIRVRLTESTSTFGRAILKTSAPKRPTVFQKY